MTDAVVEEYLLAEPLSCGSVSRGKAVTVTKAVCLRTTFVESAGRGGSEYVAEIIYLVLPRSSEELILGWPTLCRLGFVATKHYIELQAVGTRYPTILPKEAAYEANDTTQFLSAACNEALQGPYVGDPWSGPTLNTIEVDIPAGFRAHRRDDDKTFFWIEPGPNLPESCTLVEGPLKYLGPRKGLV